jgi:aspartyl-tRNA(Asn)/glutamyl-tRNA(Gln) amidotransferase subunit A
MVPFALGTDTGGSIRQPASFCGVYGLKPTYGAVSRYGLVAYASSLEVIGVLAGEVATTREVFETIAGADQMDHSSLEAPEEDLSSAGDLIKTVGVFETLDHVDGAVEKAYAAAIEGLKSAGYTIVPIEIPSLRYVVPAYYTIATAEASANLARYNGIRYGHATDWAENPEELINKSRDEGFGDEVKLRILLGTYVLRSGFQDQYYIRAQKIRTAIRHEFDQVFTQADAVMMPVYPTLAFQHGDAGLSPFQQKVADRFTASANLAGIPALAAPVGTEGGLPTGVQFLAPAFQEKRLFAVAEQMESLFPIAHPELYLGGEN